MDSADRILPHLKCPLTGSSLARYGRDKLIAVSDPATTWPIVDGVPCFLENAIGGSDHQPADTLDKFDYEPGRWLHEQFSGPTLNLSAGNTKNKPKNMFEADVVRSSNTDILLDTEKVLPFADNQFEMVCSYNAFEHYRYPQLVADEIFRILQPGGYAHILGAFLSPLHMAPHHFFGASQRGFEAWFSQYRIESVTVPWNYSPYFTLAWLADDVLCCVRDHAPLVGERFAQMTIGELSRYWEDPASRPDDLYQAFMTLPPEIQEKASLGFCVKAFKPG